MKIYNTSPSRVISYTDNGIIYNIDPLTLLEVPDQVGAAILDEWSEASTEGPAKVALPPEPWEHKAGPAWEEAKKAHGLSDSTTPPKTPTGPDTPPVEEEHIPADAVNTETGEVNDKLTNTHLCTYCQQEYKRIGDLRNHMKKQHSV